MFLIVLSNTFMHVCIVMYIGFSVYSETGKINMMMIMNMQFLIVQYMSVTTLFVILITYFIKVNCLPKTTAAYLQNDAGNVICKYGT